MDERKIAELFRAAAADAPPASFDEHTVAGASRRITARRRKTLAGGAVVAGVAVVVGLVVSLGGIGHTGGSTSAGPLAAASGQNGGMTAGANQAPMGPNRAGPGFSGTTSKQGDGGPEGGTLDGCGPTDRKLAVALANELRSVGATSPVQTGNACPAGSLTTGYHVSDGPDTGLVSVLFLAPGASRPVVPARSATAQAAAPNAGVILVVSQPDAGSPAAPFAGALPSVADAVAADLSPNR